MSLPKTGEREDTSVHGGLGSPGTVPKRKEKGLMTSLKKLLLFRHQRAAGSSSQLATPYSNVRGITSGSSEAFQTGPVLGQDDAHDFTARAPPRSSASMPVLLPGVEKLKSSFSSGLPSPRPLAFGRRVMVAPSSSALLPLPSIEAYSPAFSSGAISDHIDSPFLSPAGVVRTQHSDLKERPPFPTAYFPGSPALERTDRDLLTPSASQPLPQLRAKRFSSTSTPNWEYGVAAAPPHAWMQVGEPSPIQGAAAPAPTPPTPMNAPGRVLAAPTCAAATNSPVRTVSAKACAPLVPSSASSSLAAPSPASPNNANPSPKNTGPVYSAVAPGPSPSPTTSAATAAAPAAAPPAPAPPASSSSSTLLAVCPGAPESMRRPVWRLLDYNITGRLYKGEVSAVYKAICLRSNVKVALKVYNLMRVAENAVHTLVREVKIHTELWHDSILMMYGVFEEDNRLVLVLERASRGDLFHLHRSLPNCRMSEEQLRVLVLAPLLEALAYLHARGVCHRDVKPENLLMTATWQLRLADFGAAINMAQERAVTRTGTENYMAPEVERCPLKALPKDNKDKPDLAYTTAADVWSVGVLAYEMLVGFPPFIGCERSGAHAWLQRGRGGGRSSNGSDSAPPRELSFPHFASAGAQDFISGALAERAGDRPTAAQLLRHPWLKHALRQYQVRMHQAERVQASGELGPRPPTQPQQQFSQLLLTPLSQPQALYLQHQQEPQLPPPPQPQLPHQPHPPPPQTLQTLPQQPQLHPQPHPPQQPHPPPQQQLHHRQQHPLHQHHSSQQLLQPPPPASVQQAHSSALLLPTQQQQQQQHTGNVLYPTQPPGPSPLRSTQQQQDWQQQNLLEQVAQQPHQQQVVGLQMRRRSHVLLPVETARETQVRPRSGVMC